MLFGQGFGEIGREDVIEARPIGQRAPHEVVQQIAVACGESPALHVSQAIRVRAPLDAAENIERDMARIFGRGSQIHFPLNATFSNTNVGVRMLE